MSNFPWVAPQPPPPPNHILGQTIDRCISLANVIRRWKRNLALGLLGLHSFSWRLSYSIDNIYQISQMWSTLAGYKELAV